MRIIPSASVPKAAQIPAGSTVDWPAANETGYWKQTMRMVDTGPSPTGWSDLGVEYAQRCVEDRLDTQAWPRPGGGGFATRGSGQSLAPGREDPI